VKKNIFILMFAIIIICMAVGCTSDIVEDNGLLNPMVVLVGGIDNVPPPPLAVNIDFTVFSGEDFDEEYFSLMWETENAFGKIVRVIGTYNGFFDEETDRYLHYVLIDDAEGCFVFFF